jgi:hypothetical protein
MDLTAASEINRHLAKLSCAPPAERFLIEREIEELAARR